MSKYTSKKEKVEEVPKGEVSAAPLSEENIKLLDSFTEEKNDSEPEQIDERVSQDEPVDWPDWHTAPEEYQGDSLTEPDEKGTNSFKLIYAILEENYTERQDAMDVPGGIILRTTFCLENNIQIDMVFVPNVRLQDTEEDGVWKITK